MQTLRATLEADQRLVILRSLVDLGGTGNESVLQTCVNAFGHRASRDVIRGHLAWLASLGLLNTKTVMNCLIAEITSRGEDVAAGNLIIDGVKKPRAAD